MHAAEVSQFFCVRSGRSNRDVTNILRMSLGEGISRPSGMKGVNTSRCEVFGARMAEERDGGVVAC